MKVWALFALFLVFQFSFGQAPYWTRSKNNEKQGDEKSLQFPSITTVDSTSTDLNIPHPRMDAVTWADGKGNVYVFGGRGTDEEKNVGSLNDLWIWNTQEESWEYVTGERKISKKNLNEFIETPSNRQGAISWVDSKGNFYLFGGNTDGQGTNLNDFWQFDIKNRKWLNLNKVQSYNNKNPNVEKGKLTELYPGSRSYAASWADRKGNLWLFGGLVFDENIRESNTLNDLWKFDISKRKWQWVSGETTNEANNNENTESRNEPASRSHTAYWLDEENDRLWIYGGFSSTSHESPNKSDMWYFDLKKEVWVKQEDFINEEKEDFIFPANVFLKQVNPGNRVSPIFWKGRDGTFWLFGGQVVSFNGKIEVDPSLWQFDPKRSLWREVYSSNTPYVFSGASIFSGDQNTFWLFGGIFYDDKRNVHYSNYMWNLKFN